MDDLRECAALVDATLDCREWSGRAVCGRGVKLDADAEEANRAALAASATLSLASFVAG